MKKVMFIACVGMAMCTVLGGVSRVSATSGTIGNDVSWPNCAATPPKDAAFGIVGVTGGLVFRPNPCLFDEAHWFTNVSLYMNTGYKKSLAEKFTIFPHHCNGSDERCLAYNFGYNAGMYALNYAASQYVHAGTWWLDVETDNSWSENVLYNRASLQGMVDAIYHYELLPNIGFYAYPGQWQTITGGWQNRFPAWAATGDTVHAAAVEFCKASAFTGGKTLLAQYVKRLDTDYVC
jgi:hypothetical protein